MAFTPLRVGQKLMKQCRIPLTQKTSIFEISQAGLSGKSMRVEPIEKPKPWPYKERGYSNLHAYWDGTLKRLGENSKVILVEGLPCLGKTEVAKKLAEEFDMKCFPMLTMDAYYINPYGYDMRKLDPQIPWKHNRSFDFSDFIKNPSDDRTPNMLFTMYYMKFNQYLDALAHLLNTGEGVVLESSAYSDLAIFETMFALNYVDKWERKGYYEWRGRSLEELMKPHLVVYLDASPATVEENLKRRGKGEEKTINRNYLELLDKNYKEQFLQTISEHAEVLVYDWNTPGEAEIIVEDIETIDFDRFDILDPKMGDWRLKEEWDWSEKRCFVTDGMWRQVMQTGLLHHYTEFTPRLNWTPAESLVMNQIWDSAPGMKYAKGYNADQGDSYLFKRDTKPRHFILPD